MDFRDTHEIVDAGARGEPVPEPASLGWAFWRFVVVYIVAISFLFAFLLWAALYLLGNRG